MKSFIHIIISVKSFCYFIVSSWQVLTTSCLFKRTVLIGETEL